MKDKNKTKEQLIQELTEMRKSLAELERLKIETRRLKVLVKEKEEFLKETLDSIQDGISLLDKNLNIIFTNSAMERWYAHQFPFTGKKCYEAYHNRTEHCEICPSIRTLSSGKQDFDVVPFTGPTGIKGRLELFTFPRLDPKTGQLIGVIEYVRDITERRKAEEALEQREKELETKSSNLEEANIALKVLLKKRDEDKTELEEKILLNIKELVVPYLEKLKMSGLDEKQKTHVSILESNLNDITSSFSHRLSSKYMNFTPSEIQIANLLRQGKTNKEIGELLNTSHRTVAFHRENIRKKLGLKNKKINLKSYLLSLT